MSKKRRNAAYFVEKQFAELDGDEATIGATELHILGGEFGAERLPMFLQGWNQVPEGSFRWAMVEEVSQFYIAAPENAEAAVPDDPNLLERLRLFGPPCDLNLRRDGSRFLWSFIGEAGTDWAELNGFDSEDFWSAQNPPPIFRAVTREFQTWQPDDKRTSERWRGSTSLASKKVKLKQIHYLDNGRIAFVRYVDFVEVGNGNL